MPFTCRIVVDVPEFSAEWLAQNLGKVEFESIGMVEKNYDFTALPPIGTHISIHDLVYLTDIRVTKFLFGITSSAASQITIYASPVEEQDEEHWKLILKDMHDRGWR